MGAIVGALFGWELSASEPGKAGAQSKLLLISGGVNLAIIGAFLRLGDSAKFGVLLLIVFTCAATACWRGVRIAWKAWSE
jgi:hypothetical protein